MRCLDFLLLLVINFQSPQSIIFVFKPPSNANVIRELPGPSFRPDFRGDHRKRKTEAAKKFTI